jgi:hypothetical protein
MCYHRKAAAFTRALKKTGAMFAMKTETKKKKVGGSVKAVYSSLHRGYLALYSTSAGRPLVHVTDKETGLKMIFRKEHHAYQAAKQARKEAM